MEKSKEFLEKLNEILRKFGVSPNFKFEEDEKKIVRELGLGSISFEDLCKRYDLKPSEGRRLVKRLVAKNAAKFENETLSLTEEAIKYLGKSKEQRNVQSIYQTQE